eukprot:12195690-Alexandrium_andersonii.AAC.1
MYVDIVLANQDGHFLLVWEEVPNSLPQKWACVGAPTPQDRGVVPRGSAAHFPQPPQQGGHGAPGAPELVDRRIAYDQQ